MAEFCLECWNRLNDTKDAKWRYTYSWKRELCEECGEYKRVIVAERLLSRVLRALSETTQKKHAEQ